MSDWFIGLFSLFLYICGVICLFFPLNYSPFVLIFAGPALFCGALGMAAAVAGHE